MSQPIFDTLLSEIRSRDGSSSEVLSISNGYIEVEDIASPTSIEINGILYNVSGVEHDTTRKVFKVPVAPILAQANKASFNTEDGWRVWVV